jgi:excisionase family DNA binding protein
MVQGYYTLEESAEILGMSPDALKQLARKGEIRSFQDRGTWRFRIQDIQEMVRRSGKGSDPELPLGESLKPKPTDSPAPRSPNPKKKSDDVFGFSLGDDSGEDAIGSDPRLDKPGSSKKSGSGKKIVEAGSDSDVRLVAEGSDVSFKIPADSDVKVVGDDGPKSGPRSGKTGAGPKSPRPGKAKPDQAIPEAVDSGVRLVPIDSDSDVRIVTDSSDEHVPIGDSPPKGSTDSDIRLEGHFPPRPSDAEGLLTEEINLDEELKKDESRRRAELKQAKKRGTPAPDFPKTSPFELSESDLDLSPVSDKELPQVKDLDGSSDFDLTPAAESSSPLELGSSDDFKLEVPDDDEVTLADDSKNLKGKGPASGINLGKPADSGISLEQDGSGDSIEFELTLDAESTPKPAKPSTPKPTPGAPLAGDSDSDSSEFELSLDVDSKGKADSDSEFELTLDDSGGMAALGDESLADSGASEEKDIFETDFEVPPLEDSGSEAVALDDADTDLESSDFELAIGEDDVAAVDDDESASQVVALDEEEAVDDAAATVQAKSRAKKKVGKKTKTAALDDAADFAELDDDSVAVAEDDDLDASEEVVEDTTGKKIIRQTVVQQQTPWGIFPTLVLFPCVIVMVLLGIMGFELVQTQQGYKPGPLTRSVSGLIGQK